MLIVNDLKPIIIKMMTKTWHFLSLFPSVAIFLVVTRLFSHHRLGVTNMHIVSL